MIPKVIVDTLLSIWPHGICSYSCGRERRFIYCQAGVITKDRFTMNTIDGENTEIAILINMWDWWFLFHFSYKIATHSLANARSHSVYPRAPFNLWSPHFVPYWNWLRLYQCLCDPLRPKRLNLETFFDKKWWLVHVKPTELTFFQGILNHSYVCHLPRSDSFWKCIWLWAKQQKSKVAMQYKTIYDFYISISMRIRTFEWHNDPLSKMCACVYIVVLYWRQSTQQGRLSELSIKLGLRCDWSVALWPSHRCRHVDSSSPFKFCIYFGCRCILGTNAL